MDNVIAFPCRKPVVDTPEEWLDVLASIYVDSGSLVQARVESLISAIELERGSE